MPSKIEEIIGEHNVLQFATLSKHRHKTNIKDLSQAIYQAIEEGIPPERKFSTFDKPMYGYNQALSDTKQALDKLFGIDPKEGGKG